MPLRISSPPPLHVELPAATVLIVPKLVKLASGLVRLAGLVTEPAIGNYCRAPPVRPPCGPDTTAGAGVVGRRAIFGKVTGKCLSLRFAGYSPANSMRHKGANAVNKWLEYLSVHASLCLIVILNPFSFYLMQTPQP